MMGFMLKMMGFVLQMMDFTPKMTNLHTKMTEFMLNWRAGEEVAIHQVLLLQMMNFALKLIDCSIKNDGFCI